MWNNLRRPLTYGTIVKTSGQNGGKSPTIGKN